MARSADVARPPPAVTVAMTTWNAMPHVRDAVASILAQTLPDWELVVVDDGSTDATVATVRAFDDPRVRVLQVPRCGRIPALNQAFAAARAPLVAVQDADDVSLPDRLAVQVREFATRPNLAVLGAGLVPQIGPDGALLDTRQRPTGPRQARRALGSQMAFFHSSVMYRRQAWKEAGGFDASLPCWEDYDMCVRLAARHEVDNLPRALGLKRRHPGQAFDAIHFTNRGYRARARILFRYVRKVSPNPVVVARALAYLAMGPTLRLLWLRATRRDRAELELTRTSKA